MKILAFLLIGLLIFSFDSLAQRYPINDDREIERRVERLLQKRDVGELANELAGKKAVSAEDLLIKLSVFARAGHRQRVYEALREIGKIYPSAANQAQILRVAGRAIDDDDLTGQKIFYEQLAVDGDDRVGAFTNAWLQKGGADELENWLKARAATSETWWNAWVGVKKSRRTAGELADELARQIRENPADYALVKKYLAVVSSPVIASVVIISPVISNEWYERDVSWLAETVKIDSAFIAFELAVRLQRNHPAAAVKLLEKSLALGFTEKDAELLDQYLTQYSTFPSKVENPEKTLRALTKSALVEIYRATNRPQRAQPIIEELTASGNGNFLINGGFFTAGAVQSSTGARVVEAKILKNEKTNENSPYYWLDRAAYYEGRKEDALARQAYWQALEKFSYKPNDWQASYPRMLILYGLGRQSDDDPKVVEVLRNEFIKARANNDFKYLYALLRLLVDDYEELQEEFFVNSELLPKVLATREHWRYVDEDNVASVISGMISRIMESEKWDPKKREAVWDQLSKFAAADLKNRAYSLIDAMMSRDEYEKAIALLEESLKIAPQENKIDPYFEQDTLRSELFDIYLELGDWQKAEKVYAEGFIGNGNELGRIALLAAKSGKIDEAARLWKLYANLDRRNLENLAALAQTEAKPLLREFYKQMKAADTLTDAPDKALLILK